MHEGKLLLVRHAHSEESYVFPGGHLDFGEDPQECIKRELIEELGIEPKIGRLLYVHTFINAEEVQSVEFFFEIANGEDYLEHALKEKSHGYEIADVSWIAPKDTIQILPEAIGLDFNEEKLFSEGVRFVKG